MSTMQAKDKFKPLAISVSDLHLSLRPPVARSVEKDWLKVQAKYLQTLEWWADRWEIPIICAGDIFHNWNAPAELINFAINNLPTMYAIPGQHDLPLHNYSDIEKSAYYTLVQAGKIKNLTPDHVKEEMTPCGIIAMHAFPWGFPIKPNKTIEEGKCRIAIIHHYVWNLGHGFAGAPMDHHVTNLKDKLMGYDFALFGDNHKRFTQTVNGAVVVNNGGFQRRNADEINNKPAITLLGMVNEEFSIKEILLEVTEDKFLPQDDLDRLSAQSKEYVDFMSSLSTLKKEFTGDNFEDAIRQFAKKNNVSPEVIQILDSILDESIQVQETKTNG